MSNSKDVKGYFVILEGEKFYKLENYDRMDDFFMTITSSSDVWNFLWAKGGITAGRKNADHAIFQYGTADRIADYKYTTGSYTAIQVETAEGVALWEPFGRFLQGTGAAGIPEDGVQYSLYKNINGSKVIFEARNEALQLVFRYGWTSGRRFIFIPCFRLFRQELRSGCAGKSCPARFFTGVCTRCLGYLPSCIYIDCSGETVLLWCSIRAAA